MNFNLIVDDGLYVIKFYVLCGRWLIEIFVRIVCIFWNEGWCGFYLCVVIEIFGMLIKYILI